MSFAKPKDSRDKKSTSKDHYKSPQRGQSGKMFLQQNHSRGYNNQYNKPHIPQLAIRRREFSPNYSPQSKTQNIFTQSRDNLQSPRHQRCTYQGSNNRMNQSCMYLDRIDRLEETLNRVCYNVDYLLPLLDLVGSHQNKNVNAQGGTISVNSSTGNLFQKNESLQTLCKKMSDHEIRISNQDKMILNLRKQQERIDHSQQQNINQIQNRPYSLGGKENLAFDIMSVKQPKIEDKIAEIELFMKNEFEKIKQNNALLLQNNALSQQNNLDVQLLSIHKQLNDLQFKQETIKTQSDSHTHFNNYQTLSTSNSKKHIGIQDFDVLNNITDQISAIGEQVNELKEFRQFCWKEMDNLWRNIGHLFCDAELRNKFDIQQKIDVQTQDIPSTATINERNLKISIIEYFNYISNLEKFNNQNTGRIMNNLSAYNSQIDKLMKQQENIYLQYNSKDLEIYLQEIDTLEDRFINVKFQIEGTKQKMIFEMKKIEDKAELVEQIKHIIVKNDTVNIESVKQDFLITDHLKQKVQSLMDEVSKNIRQISDTSDNVMARLVSELKRGAASLEKSISGSNTLIRSRRGSEDGTKVARKIAFGKHEEIVYQPYTKNHFFIQLYAIQNDENDVVKEL